MQGTQFLSVLLKVNPFFTVALAVGFIGVAAVGVKQVDGVTLKKLIPLHVKSLFSGDKPLPAATDISDFEIAQHTAQELMSWPGMPIGYDNTAPSAPSKMPPGPPQLFRYGPSKDIARPRSLPAGMGAGQPKSKVDRTTAGDPDNAPNEPLQSNADLDETTPAYLNFVAPTSAPQFTTRLPPRPFQLIKPYIPDSLPIPMLQVSLPPTDIPAETLRTYPFFQLILSPFRPGGPIVETSEPPMHLVFAGMFVVLVALRHRATRGGGRPTAIG